MKMKCIILLAFSIPLLLRAQITVNVVHPPAGMITRDQLWNLVLTNSGNTIQEVTILLNLKDAVTGQSVLSAGTRSILLNKGVKVLSIQDIQPVQYNAGTSGVVGNFLPPGSYIACYTIGRYMHEAMENITTECARINITPLSPPLLNTPANKAELETPAPQLTWIPPAPMDMFDNLTYEINVTEVLDGQSAAEAIRYNTPVFTSAHIKAPYENYPSTYSALQKGKTYAWQVTARNGESYATATDVWTFSLKPDSAKKALGGSYILFNGTGASTGVNYLTGNMLRLKYYSYDKTHESVIRLYDEQQKQVQEIKRTIIYGDNFLVVNLNHLYHKNKVYRIQITDQQKNSYTISFSLQ